MQGCCHHPEGSPNLAVPRTTSLCIVGWLAALLLIATTAAAQSSSPHPPEAPSIPECETVGQDISHGDALLKVCEYAATLPQRIPNFSCEQKTSRFLNGHAADVVTARVTYTDGKESYQDIRTDKGPVTGAALPKVGTWSTGQFESDIRAIFIGGNKTIWHFAGDNNIDGRPALIFRYEIPRQDNPVWQLHMHRLSAAPPYKGELWIDDETFSPLRLDVSATDLPADFPIRSADVEISYGDVPFGDGTSFVLPVKSVVDSTATAGRQSHNVLEFQNCHKFRATARMVPAN